MSTFLFYGDDSDEDNKLFQQIFDVERFKTIRVGVGADIPSMYQPFLIPATRL